MTANAARADAVRVTAQPDEVGRRLDNYLLGRLKGVPRSHIYRLIRSGEVRVNSRRVKASYRLCAGDQIRVPPVRPAPASGAASAPAARADWILSRILYQDDDVLVLDKPAGLAVHGGSGISLGAIELLRAVHASGARLALVHRLDRETSGCLLVARRAAALRDLHAQFRAGSVEKHYLALLLGRWTGGSRLVTAPLLTHHRRGGERHVQVDPAGRSAHTEFVPLEAFPDAVLARVVLGTGRTHQIRVHAASIGHPVAGDDRYGQEQHPLAARVGLTRLFLHAQALTFSSPADGRRVQVEAPPGADLTAVLERLREAGQTASIPSRASAPATQIRGRP